MRFPTSPLDKRGRMFFQKISCGTEFIVDENFNRNKWLCLVWGVGEAVFCDG
eukprot:m.88879 g.88879  ORF g.88879 m.88879 type:complete len:52 (+) comp8817_c0_seq3:1902-2057(+)